MSKKVNGFSLETIKKTVAAIKAGIAYFTEKLQHGENVTITISKGNKKIGKTWNLSTAPIVTCHRCSVCMFFCYAVRDIFKFGYDFLKNCVLRSRAKNTAVLLFDRDMFFNQVDSFCSGNKKIKVFRWHVSGEILDKDYFNRMCAIAVNHTDWIFWSYTKMYEYVNDWIRENGNNKNALPKNLNIMFSRWINEPVDNPFNLPEFWTVEEIPDGAENVCCGNCQFCLENKTGCPYGVSMLCKKH